VTVFPRATNHHPYRQRRANDSSGVLSSRYGQGTNGWRTPSTATNVIPASILMNKVTELLIGTLLFEIVFHGVSFIVVWSDGTRTRRRSSHGALRKNPLIPSTTSTAAAID